MEYNDYELLCEVLGALPVSDRRFIWELYASLTFLSRADFGEIAGLSRSQIHRRERKIVANMRSHAQQQLGLRVVQ